MMLQIAVYYCSQLVLVAMTKNDHCSNSLNSSMVVIIQKRDDGKVIRKNGKALAPGEKTKENKTKIINR